MNEPGQKAIRVVHPSFSDALRFWVKLGFISFGGPTGQIAMMYNELVEKKKWISETRFLHALNFCMILPGPEAQQLAIYVGWLLHKTKGGIVAGAFFVIPSIFILWSLSAAYMIYGNIPWVASIFYGLKPAVMAIVAAAVIRIGKKALKNEVMWVLAALAFVAIFFLKLPFPIIILSAGLIGLMGGKLWKEKFFVLGNHSPKSNDNNGQQQSVLGDEQESSPHTKPSVSRAIKVSVVCLILWTLPVALLGYWQGKDGVLFHESIFFSKAAMVTFGGAYAVLPYVAQRAVESFHWLSAPQMMDGLGLAETTPGPLIMVLQFVGFLGGWNHPNGLSPLLAATLGALVTTWVTFVPCFLWIFLGAPYIEKLRGNVHMTSTLSAITAAVVGVVLNLAVWFGIHALFPSQGHLDIFTLTVGALCFLAMQILKWDVMVIVLTGGFLGFVYRIFIP